MGTFGERQSKAFGLLAAATFLATTLSGCVTATDAVDLSSAQNTPQLREFDFYVFGDTTFDVDGRSLFTFRYSLTPEGPGSIPGPELRVKEGDTVRVRLHGQQFHTIHWHGLSVPWEMDGVPFLTQDMDQDVHVYEFVAHETGTYWYHCHVDAPVHVDLGMFGALIVEPRDKRADPHFDREEVLILHEMDSTSYALVDAFESGSTRPLENAPNNPGHYPDFLVRAATATLDIAGLIAGEETGIWSPWSGGPSDHYPFSSLRYVPKYDLFMFNGKSYPDTDPLHIASGETLRIRVISAGQLPHALHLHGHKFLVTHKDGDLLAAPYKADTLPIMPGERYDIYVTGNNPGIWDFHDHAGTLGSGAYAANQGLFPGGMNTMLVYDDFERERMGAHEHAQARTSGDYMLFAKAAKARLGIERGITNFHDHHAGAAHGSGASTSEGVPLTTQLLR